MFYAYVLCFVDLTEEIITIKAIRFLLDRIASVLKDQATFLTGEAGGMVILIQSSQSWRCVGSIIRNYWSFALEAFVSK